MTPIVFTLLIIHLGGDRSVATKVHNIPTKQACEAAGASMKEQAPRSYEIVWSCLPVQKPQQPAPVLFPYRAE